MATYFLKGSINLFNTYQKPTTEGILELEMGSKLTTGWRLNSIDFSEVESASGKISKIINVSIIAHKNWMVEVLDYPTSNVYCSWFSCLHLKKWAWKCLTLHIYFNSHLSINKWVQIAYHYMLVIAGLKHWPPV